ncbi:hypothetical protein BH11BAC3_BH11BAC3_07390 [soil metagenome]
MISHEEFFKLPGWEEIIGEIKYSISQAQRPASEIILDDVDLCKTLKIGKRTSATIRANRDITYHKCGGKILYKLSDVLDYINRNKVEAEILTYKTRIK